MTKTFTAKQATAILNRAVAIQAKTRTLEELRETAAGAGVEMRWLDQAIAEAERPAWLVRAARATWAGALKPILRFGWRYWHLATPVVPFVVAYGTADRFENPVVPWCLAVICAGLMCFWVAPTEFDFQHYRRHPSKDW